MGAGGGGESSTSARQRWLELDLCVHVFTVSAGLVGVCLTVIGIIRIVVNLNSGYTTIADELLAVDSLLFVSACLLAYFSLRSRATRPEWSVRLESVADRLLIAGLAAMSIICLLLAFSLA